jgi:hypothetical protein
VNKKILSLVVGVLVICAVMATILIESSTTPTQLQPTKALDFTIGGVNNCLRFLNNTVSIGYIPFIIAANQHWQLTINCTKMPGGANGYTDIYVYKGYWDNGTDHKCTSGDVYSILSNIQSAGFELKGATSYNATYGSSTQESYTVFFVLPPGGPTSFHVTYKQVTA